MSSSETSFPVPPCRFCGNSLDNLFVDLGTTPLCNSMVSPADARLPEAIYPLTTRVCEQCLLVQADDVVPAEQIFGAGDYTYFSSFSVSWLAHAKSFCLAMIDDLELGPESLVMEVASNDGYLLRNFVDHFIPVLGIDPASNCAEVAEAIGVRTHVGFLGRKTATKIENEHGLADLVVGNNVLAHVPDINDFVAGLQMLLAPNGVLSMEFPHLMRLVQDNQFDTIYHEHFSYLSLHAVQRIFAAHGLAVFDVEELNTHGGSLRVLAQRSDSGVRPTDSSVGDILGAETNAGMETMQYYAAFGERVAETKRGILEFLIEQKRAGKSIAAYGAPGKGNTLINYLGIGTDFIDFTVDRSPHKQGKLLPGSRIPVYTPEFLFERKPDIVLILPWNLADEIASSMAGIADWGGRFVVPIPTVKVLEPSHNAHP